MRRYIIPIVMTILLFSIGVLATTIRDDYITQGNYTQNNTGQFYNGEKTSVRTADVVVCRGNNVLDDLYKSFTCDVVCESTDSDCGDDISLAYSKLSNGGSLLIRNAVYPVSTTIDFTLKNSTHVSGDSRSLDTTGGLLLNWTGGASSVIDFTSANYFYLEQIGINGNNKASNGILIGNNYAKHPQHNSLYRLSIIDINGTALNLSAYGSPGSMVDSHVEDIYIDNAKIGIVADGQQVTYTDVIISSSDVGFNIISYSSGQYYGGVFSGNDIDIKLSGEDGISKWLFSGTWFELSTRTILERTLTPVTTEYTSDFNFVSTRLHTSGNLLMNFTNVKGQVNFYGVDTGASVSRNIYMPSLMSSSAITSEELFFIGDGKDNVVKIYDGSLYLSNTTRIFDNSGSLNILSGSDLYIKANTGIANTLLYGHDLFLVNISSYNQKVCMDGVACAFYLQYNGSCIKSSGSGNCI